MNPRMRQIAVWAAAWVLVAGTLSARAAEPRATGNNAVSALIERTMPAYVFISGGSGVVISPDGLLLSNTHVIDKQRSFNVRLGDGRSFTAKVLGYHVFGDLALLQIENGKDLPYLPLGDSAALQAGDFCLAIGNPLTLGLVDQLPTISIGVISAKQPLGGNYADGLVIDASINPGNSGGPLINSKGELVGINGQMHTRMGLRSNTGLGFAIPSERIKRWLPLLKAAKGKEVRHGRLNGIEWENPGRAAQTEFVPPIIRKVMAGSDAERVGFHAGDKILQCQGQAVRLPLQLHLLLAMYPTPENLSVRLERDGKELTLQFKLEPFED